MRIEVLFRHAGMTKACETELVFISAFGWLPAAMMSVQREREYALSSFRVANTIKRVANLQVQWIL